MADREILVSVIMPVYNTEKYLKRSLESALGQTMEQLEVVAIDDGSTDGSGKLLDQYLEKYPDRLQVLHTKNHGQGIARNLAIKKARGTYLAFCDADDCMIEDSVKRMYERSEKEDSDLVYGASYRVRGNGKYLLGLLPKPVTKRSMLLDITPFTLWSLLIKKELWEQNGGTEDMIYQDVAYIPVLIAAAQKVSYEPAPVYYWMDREDSTVHRTKEKKILDFIKAAQMAIANIDPAYRDEIVMNMAEKTIDKSKAMWYFGDVFFDYFKSLESMIKNNGCYLADPGRYKEITFYLNLEGEKLPKIVYLDGFSEKLTPGQAQETADKMFRDGGTAVVLSRENCSLHENAAVERAVMQKDDKFLAGYFAMRRIYEEGGMYMASGMKPNGPFDCMRAYPAFFSYLDEEEFTDKVFGAGRKNEAVKRMLELIEEEPKSGVSLGGVIRQALTEKYKVEMDGRTTYSKYPVVLLSPLAVLTPVRGTFLDLSECRDFDMPKEDLFTLPKSTLAGLVNYPVPWQGTQIKNWKYKYSESQKQSQKWKRKYTEQTDKLTKQIDKLNALKETDQYKVGKALGKSKVGRVVMRLCLKIFG